MLGVAEEAARAAGDVLLERFGGPRREVRSKSTPTDLVSEADLEAESALRRVLGLRRPQDGVLGEEGGDRGAGTSGVRWIVDPLDGTVNFLFGIPQWCVSVACEDGAGPIAAVVLDPLRGELFAATRGGVATLDGERIRASERDELATAMVATGFAYDSERRAAQAEVAARVLPAVRDLRRMGSAALDLAWTACGRYDAFYERGLQAWDRAAGELICERSGLDLRELEAREALSDGLLAAPAALIDPLYALVGP